jgi:uncharacterized protein YycO
LPPEATVSGGFVLIWSLLLNSGMQRSKLVFLLLFVVLIFSGAFLKRHTISAFVKLNRAEKEVEKLAKQNEIKSGDIIFQSSLSAQSQAIQLTTHSPYSHCGIIYQEGGKYFVYEAIQPVKATPLEKWITRGKEGHYVIKRLKNAEEILTPTVLQKMKKVGRQFNGKNYDLYFEWSDDRIYCSELIWKIYKQATGLEIGKLEKLKDFDLSYGPVKVKMKERYGNKIPLDETVISPASMFSSELLETVQEK